MLSISQKFKAPCELRYIGFRFMFLALSGIRVSYRYHQNWGLCNSWKKTAWRLPRPKILRRGEAIY